MRFYCLIFSCFLVCFCHAQKATFNLTVTVTNLRNSKGMVELGLYRNAENFAKVGLTFKQIRTPFSGNEVTVVFHDLNEGKYGVCIYHDENNNKSCDRNFFGFPTEPYGFSNNIRPVFSIPSFESCAVKLDKNKSITIKNSF